MKDLEAKKSYKSPRRKLVKFFEKSRNQWKAKCLGAKKQVKRLKNRIRFLEQSKAHWKNCAREFETELTAMKARQEELEKELEKKNCWRENTFRISSIFCYGSLLSSIFSWSYHVVYILGFVSRREFSGCEPFY